MILAIFIDFNFFYSAPSLPFNPFAPKYSKRCKKRNSTLPTEKATYAAFEGEGNGCEVKPNEVRQGEWNN